MKEFEKFININEKREICLMSVGTTRTEYARKSDTLSFSCQFNLSFYPVVKNQLHNFLLLTSSTSDISQTKTNPSLSSELDGQPTGHPPQ